MLVLFKIFISDTHNFKEEFPKTKRNSRNEYREIPVSVTLLTDKHKEIEIYKICSKKDLNNIM